MKIVGISKIREIGGSLGIILHKNLFKEFDAKKGDAMVVKYDEVKDIMIICKGGM